MQNSLVRRVKKMFVHKNLTSFSLDSAKSVRHNLILCFISPLMCWQSQSGTIQASLKNLFDFISWGKNWNFVVSVSWRFFQFVCFLKAFNVLPTCGWLIGVKNSPQQKQVSTRSLFKIASLNFNMLFSSSSIDEPWPAINTRRSWYVLPFFCVSPHEIFKAVIGLGSVHNKSCATNSTAYRCVPRMTNAESPWGMKTRWWQINSFPELKHQTH